MILVSHHIVLAMLTSLKSWTKYNYRHRIFALRQEGIQIHFTPGGHPTLRNQEKNIFIFWKKTS